MPTIALLRGVNVGGNRKVPMTALKAVAESLGLLRVQTYIQSGNLVFEGEISRAGYTDSVYFVYKSEQNRFAHSTSGTRLSPSPVGRIFRCFQHLSIGVRIRGRD